MKALCSAAPWSPDKDGLCTDIIFRPELAASTPALPTAGHPAAVTGTTLKADRGHSATSFFLRAADTCISPCKGHLQSTHPGQITAIMPCILSVSRDFSAFQESSLLLGVCSCQVHIPNSAPLFNQSSLGNSCPPTTNNKASIARREEVD